ncbi:3-dehydroquinate synthase [Arachis hypogaea]|nr:3-dehydroquinate synthase [Arachis hypogaea]
MDHYQHVMTSALERGWNTFLFSSPHQNLLTIGPFDIRLILSLRSDCSKNIYSLSRILTIGLLIHWNFCGVKLAELFINLSVVPRLALNTYLDGCVEEYQIVLYVVGGEYNGVELWRDLDGQGKRVASVIDVSTPEELERLRPEDEQSENIVVNLLIGSQKRVFAISNSTSEAKIFLEALEHGLDGIVLKVEDVEHVLELKEYFDKRAEESNLLSLTKATVTRIQVAGMGDRVCVDLCSLMKPGEGLMVGSFARGLFLVHSECLESNYIASRPFRVNAGPVHAYVAVPGGRTCYLSELKSGKEVIVVDQQGRQRVAIVGRVKIETRPLILVEAKRDSDSQTVSILLQNAETVALICPPQGEALSKSSCSGDITQSRRRNSVTSARRGSAYRNRDSRIHS